MTNSDYTSCKLTVAYRTLVTHSCCITSKPAQAALMSVDGGLPLALLCFIYHASVIFIGSVWDPPGQPNLEANLGSA